MVDNYMATQQNIGKSPCSFMNICITYGFGNLFQLLDVKCWAGFDTTSAADCSGLADGTYMIDCLSYYVCNKGVATELKCSPPPAENIVFNNATGKCDKPKNAGSPCGGIHFDCSDKADRDYADKRSNCTKFAICYGGVLEGYHKCPSNLFFHEYIQSCDWKKNTPRPCGTKI